MIETSHSSEVFSWDAWGVVLANHSVSVGGVAYNDSLDSALSVVVDCFTGVDEDLTVILEEVGTFHTRSARLGTNQEVEINIFKRNFKVAGNDDVVKKGESAIVELSLDTLKCVFCKGEIKKVKNDSLVWSEE